MTDELRHLWTISISLKNISTKVSNTEKKIRKAVISLVIDI